MTAWQRRQTGDIIRGGGTCTLVEGGQTRSTASGISRATRGVELLDEAESTFVLKLGMSVRGEIEAEVGRVNEIGRAQVGRPAESGGYLFSPPRRPSPA